MSDQLPEGYELLASDDGLFDVLVDPHGTVVRAWGTDAETGLEVEVNPGDYDIELEQPAPEPQQSPQRPVQPAPPPAAEHDQEVLYDLGRQYQQLEAEIVGKLLATERRTIAKGIADQIESGYRPSIYEVVDDALARGDLRDYDKTNHDDDRVALATARLEEREIEERGDDPHDTTPRPSQASYDRAKHEDRVAWSMDKLAGADVSGMDYDSRDPVEED